VLSSYLFKARVGIYHTAVFASHTEKQAVRPTKLSYSVIMENCIRCHTQLNTAMVKTGMFTYADTLKGNGKACWDCHTQVPHGKISNIAAPSEVIAPFPKSPVPDWIKKTLN
jgi:cytochrome c nitrite reductase small subunit